MDDQVDINRLYIFAELVKVAIARLTKMRSLSQQKKGANPQNDSAHNRHRDKPDRARDRADTRTNQHHTAHQPRGNEGKGSSTTTGREPAPADRARKRPHRRTQHPRTTTARQGTTDNGTEGNRNATNRRTRTNREGKTHDEKPPKGHNVFLGAGA